MGATLLTLGVLLLLVGLIGQVNAKEISVGTKNPYVRVILGIIGFVFVIIAIGTFITGSSQNTPSPSSTPTPTQTSIPTYTSTPTQTPVPTSTPSPTFTPTSSIPIGIIMIPNGSKPVTVDGVCNTGNDEEYSDARKLQFKEDTQYGFIYVKHDRDYVYICMIGVYSTFDSSFAVVNFAPNNNDDTTVNQLRVNIKSRTSSASLNVNDWSAIATHTAGSGDMAEFRIPVAETYGWPCNTIFKMIVVHFWVTATNINFPWGIDPGINMDSHANWTQVALGCP